MNKKHLDNFLSSVYYAWKCFQLSRIPITLTFGDVGVAFYTLSKKGEVLTRLSVVYGDKGLVYDYYCEDGDEFAITRMMEGLNELKWEKMFLKAETWQSKK